MDESLRAPHDATPDDVTTGQVRRALEGDETSLNWVVTRFTPLLEAQARYRMPGMGLDAQPEDIIAEAWLVALPRLDGFVVREGRQTPRLLAFLSTIVLNLINRKMDAALRRRASRPVSAHPFSSGVDPMELHPAEITDAVIRASRAELRSSITEVLGRLSTADQEVVILRGIEGLSNLEAAEELGETPTTISHRYCRALRKLRDRLPNSIFDDLVQG